MNTTSENAKPASKAGRNLPAAIGVGVSFGLVLVLGLFIQPVLVAFLQYPSRLRYPRRSAGGPRCGVGGLRLRRRIRRVVACGGRDFVVASAGFLRSAS